jgi:pyridoxine 5-phosphate synthase
MARLSVNLDHVATLRQLRGTDYPDILQAAGIVRQGGADGITLHLRKDRRHIQLSDVEKLSRFELPLTLEVACTEDNLAIAIRTKPAAVTFVPEEAHELTTMGGMNLDAVEPFLKGACQDLKRAGIRPCFFLEAREDDLRRAVSLGAEMVEIHTGGIAELDDPAEEVASILSAAKIGRELGLVMNAGHALTYENVRPFAASGLFHEFSIGHVIICRAVFVGLETAVVQMKKAVEGQPG